jgi:hypothetical protein
MSSRSRYYIEYPAWTDFVLSLSDISLNDSDNAVAWILPPLAQGDSIGGLRVFVSTRVGSPPSYRIAFTTNPFTWPSSVPTGYNGSSPELFSPPSSTGWFSINLTTPISVQSSDDVIYAIVFPGPTPPNTSNYIAVRRSMSGYSLKGYSYSYSYTTLWLSASPPSSTNTMAPIVNGSYIDIGANGVSSQSASSTTEDGVRFSLPFSASCIGVSLRTSYTTDQTVSVTASLYDDADNILRQTSLSNYRIRDILFVCWPSPINLSAYTWYRLGFVTSVLRTSYYAVFSNYDAMRNMLNGFASDYIRRPAGGGSWTTVQYAGLPVTLLLSNVNIGTQFGFLG